MGKGLLDSLRGREVLLVWLLKLRGLGVINFILTSLYLEVVSIILCSCEAFFLLFFF